MKVTRNILHDYLFKLTVLLYVIFFSSVEITAMKVSDIQKYSKEQKIKKEQKIQQLCFIVNKIGNNMVKIIKDLRNKNIPVEGIKREMFVIYHQNVKLFEGMLPPLQKLILKELQTNKKYDFIENFIKSTRRSMFSQELENNDKPIERLFDVILYHYQAELQIREKFEEDSKKFEQSWLGKIWGWFGKK